MDNFQKRFNKLNKEQKRAVVSTEGPVMVIAGPGTGKTEIIGMRTAYICKEGLALPENILITTFTESGVTAIRNRLIDIMGKDAYKVGVFTIHGFCSEVISENPEKFLFAKNIKNISEIERIEIFKKILDELNLKYLVSFSNRYHFLKDIIKSIQTLKREDITIEKFHRHLKVQKDELEASKKINKKTGKPINDWQKKEKDLLKNLELLEIYKKYQQTLQEKGYYDYEDMIMFVVKKFQEDDELLAKYQEQYLYIMLDEYQDTNSAQNDVVSLLVSFFADQKPNIFVVGDDDQSIYRFQGASLENILFFSKKYNIKDPIVLKENYRSTQNILDASLSLIKNNKNRIENFIEGIDKNLHSNKKENGKINVLSFSFEDAETYFIYEKIKELINKKTSPSQIAVFTRTNAQAHKIAEFLEKNDIPTVFESSNDILKGQAVKMFLALLEAVQNPSSDKNLWFVMSFDFWGIEPKDIYKILLRLNKINYSAKDPVALFELLIDKNFLDELELENKNAINNFINKISNFKKLSSELSFASFCETVLKESGFLTWIHKKEEKIGYLKHLSTLFSVIKDLNIQNDSLDLEEFLQKIKLYKEYNIPIKEDGFLLQKDGVEVMTAHKSKGLEFEYVFLVNATDKNWGNRRKQENIKLPENLLEASSKIVFEKNEDERRLFFVAITRAKKEIFITYANQYKDGETTKECVPSQFIEEIDNSFLEKKEINFSLDSQEIFLDKKVKSKRELKEEEYIKSILKDYKLSITHLDNYLKCPKMFKYQNLLLVPHIKSKSMAMGTAFHKALEKFFLEYKKTGKLPPKELLVFTYESALDYEILTYKEKEELKKIGKEGLLGYYEKYKNEMVIPEAVEYNFSSHNVHLGDIFLTGKIDKIEKISENDVKVIDYKTGKIHSENEIAGNTKKSDGKLKRQIVFYKILCDLDSKFKYNMVLGELDFVQGKDGKYKKVQVSFTNEDIQKLKETIQDVHRKIMNLEFNCNQKAGFCDACKEYSLQ